MKRDAMTARLFPWRRSQARALTLCLTFSIVLSVALSSCGAAQTVHGGPAPESASDPDSDPAQPPSLQSEAADPAEPSDPCADGSCTQCGAHVCLKGFYCDEALEACSWLPACARELSCGCVKSQLKSCVCEERSGGVYVRCE